jgi:hypothetical protein
VVGSGALIPHSLSYLRIMSQASSSSARTRWTSTARDALHPRSLAVVAAAPLGVTDDLEASMDEVTGLPLIRCPECMDVRVFAATTTQSQRNIGKRYFKCPRKNYVSVVVHYEYFKFHCRLPKFSCLCL